MTDTAEAVSTRCSRCKVEKLFMEFPTDTKKKDGVSSWCKACVRDAHAERAGKKRQPEGDDLLLTVNASLDDDWTIKTKNKRAYAKRAKGKTCAFQGCLTRIRYRSAYAPWCDLHGTKDRREKAMA